MKIFYVPFLECLQGFWHHSSNKRLQYMNSTSYLPRKSQRRGSPSFSSFRDYCERGTLTLSLSCPRDNQSSYCSLRKKQILTKQERLKQNNRKQEPGQNPLNFMMGLNQKRKQEILKVTPAVMYSSLKHKRQFCRMRTITESGDQLQRSKTENYECTAESSFSLRYFKKSRCAEHRNKGSIEPATYLEKQMQKRPCTAEVGSNRLRTLYEDLPNSKVQLFSGKLRGWQTKLDNDDF